MVYPGTLTSITAVAVIVVGTNEVLFWNGVIAEAWAMIVARPSACADTSPVASTVATALSLLVHVTLLQPLTTLPLASNRVADS